MASIKYSLKRTNKVAHITRKCDGEKIDRRIYEDNRGVWFIKLYGYDRSLEHDIAIVAKNYYTINSIEEV